MATIQDSDSTTAFNGIKPSDGRTKEIEMLSGLWTTMLTSLCDYDAGNFQVVMQNLLKNPNIMSPSLFRADIFYDSDSDSSTLLQTVGDGFGGDTCRSDSAVLKQIKAEYRPVQINVPGFQWQRTVVRSLVPRNRQLDREILQTCHFYQGVQDGDSVELVMYIPHVSNAEEMPWYHPRAKRLAFTHSSCTDTSKEERLAMLGIHIQTFPTDSIKSLEPRLSRTCLNLLSTLHRHGQGNKIGYEKRVHHDLVVAQQPFQETYSYLKIKYARDLISNWVESTDPTKHVFEDLGIAAFLIELWKELYDFPASNQEPEANLMADKQTKKRIFPGFVDIGCGNGVLVHILTREGYAGWGFDARKRKTWSAAPSDVQSRLKELVLVPSVLDKRSTTEPGSANSTSAQLRDKIHNGIFEPQGAFIISNHADELTSWTPLLAFLNESDFIAIPCCSHDLAGQRFRAPDQTRKQMSKNKESRKQGAIHKNPGAVPSNDYIQSEREVRALQAAETGTLARDSESEATAGNPLSGGGKPISAYASLCSYLTNLAVEIGFAAPRKEMLRIPSTRNTCILGNYVARDDWNRHEGSSRRRVEELVSREMDMAIAEVGKIWVDRTMKLTSMKYTSH